MELLTVALDHFTIIEYQVAGVALELGIPELLLVPEQIEPRREDHEARIALPMVLMTRA